MLEMFLSPFFEFKGFENQHVIFSGTQLKIYSGIDALKYEVRESLGLHFMWSVNYYYSQPLLRLLTAFKNSGVYTNVEMLGTESFFKKIVLRFYKT